MRRVFFLTLALISLLVFSATRTPVSAVRSHKNPANYAAGDVIVKLKPSASQLQTPDTVERLSRVATLAGDQADLSYRNPAVQLVGATANKRVGEIISRLGLDRTFVLKIDAGADIDAMVSRLRTLDEVEYAEPNYLVKPGSVIPDDPNFSQQWSLLNTGVFVDNFPATPNADIKADQAWDITLGSPDVIVAVVDTGIDLTHPDLVSNIYTNPKEIAGNGIDDDQNGYIDDVWRWNFLSDKQGHTVTRLQRDVTQIYKLWKDKYEKADRAKLKPDEKEEYDIYQKAKKEWEKKYQFVLAYKLVMNDSAHFFSTLKDFADHTSHERMPRVTLVSYDPGADQFKQAVKKVLQGGFFPQNDSINLDDMVRNLPALWRGFNNYAQDFLFDYDLDYEPLKIIGDDPSNPYEKKYGSPYLIKTPKITFDFDHDTHIAGIIGAKRNNGIGIDGIADNVKIMMVKAMTGGDERDKDIANAIRYAVDNGAKVINMSWGKEFSSHKKVVDEAVQYAEAHDVLLVHAAGNDGNDCDTADFYPITKFRNGESAKNMLQVGCSTTNLDSHLPAWYSNYGKNTVDLFAPGDGSYGPFHDNQYGYAGGTSNAAPFVVGVAALLKSYFPELTMIQIKNIILETAYRPNIKVIRPHFVNPAFPPAQRQLLMNQEVLVPFSSLSKTGGILDAEAAVKKAIEMTKK